MMVVFSNVLYVSLWGIAWTSEGSSLVEHQFQCHMTPPLNKKNKERAVIVGLGKELTHSEIKCMRRRSLETTIEP